MMNEHTDIFWNELEAALPPLIPRKKVGQLTAGLISPRYMANLDHRSLGPEGRVRIGKNICYSKKNFISWLRARSPPP